MEKKYKHKKSGLIVSRKEGEILYSSGTGFHMPIYVIEGTNDWELIEDAIYSNSEIRTAFEEIGLSEENVEDMMLRLENRKHFHSVFYKS